MCNSFGVNDEIGGGPRVRPSTFDKLRSGGATLGFGVERLWRCQAGLHWRRSKYQAFVAVDGEHEPQYSGPRVSSRTGHIRSWPIRRRSFRSDSGGTDLAATGHSRAGGRSLRVQGRSGAGLDGKLIPAQRFRKPYMALILSYSQEWHPWPRSNLYWR